MQGWIGEIGTIASIATALIIVCSANKIAPAYGAADGQPIGGIQCDREEFSIFHIHAHLDIFVNGQPYAVPESIGIINDRTCLYWMHTHDRSGIIHIEAPQTRTFTLGQFFDIWKATVKGVPVTKEPPKVFVNGKRVNGRVEQVEITSFAEIAVVYGKEPSAIPSSYDFPEIFRKKPS
jgi:hypothetical protein